MNSNAKYDVCFISNGYLYSLLTGKHLKKIIGPDIQQMIISNELSRNGKDVILISFNEYENCDIFINGIRFIGILKSKSPSKSFQIIINTINLWQVIKNIDSNIYINGGGLSGIIYPYCKLSGRKYVYPIASDKQVDTIHWLSGNLFASIGNWIDIKFADKIIVQSEYQKLKIEKNFNRESTLIKMPFSLSERKFVSKTNPPIVLWVGAIDSVKQPELFIKLAESLPSVHFQMIGGQSGNDEYHELIRRMAKNVPNLEFLGIIPYDRIDAYFSEASILVNTSKYEGFPNAFIQSWMNYTPILSLNSNPDMLIINNNMGMLSQSFDKLRQDLIYLLNNDDLRITMGKNARIYVEREHDIKKTIDIYLKTIDSLNARCEV